MCSQAKMETVNTQNDIKKGQLLSKPIIKWCFLRITSLIKAHVMNCNSQVQVLNSYSICLGYLRMFTSQDWGIKCSIGHKKWILLNLKPD